MVLRFEWEKSQEAKDYNYTTAALSISGVLIYWAIHQYRFMDLIPTARDAIFNQISDALLVLDAQLRIIDLNPAAGDLFSGIPLTVGVPLTDLEHHPIIKGIIGPILSGASRERCELPGKEQLVYDIKVSRLTSGASNPSGYLVTVIDMTERFHLTSRIEQLSRQDPLTGLYNRGYIIGVIKRLLEEQQVLSLAIFNIDRFKIINDTYGHQEADRALQQAVSFVRSSIKEHQILGRWGGDEFILLFPGEELHSAVPAAHRIQHTIQALKLTSGNRNISLSVTCGVSSTSLLQAPPDIEALISLADRAMARGKLKGRNQVVSAETLAAHS